ncbi:SOS response-associated peptidase [Marinactinospora thermotolerans]|uniref:Abasic site processing protein n=1 Tax=Marinactinospora thermotolerans DSM 45154 TaxID=1122192 RepID=A0A1T4SDS7_9ACTN|nr:SOS response-associated peptidase [Marinactinospora thermotolerans]SKA26038.1 Putative SOS response-associated peptidase YedK [Marinactinospora thermotolerans DSM 45154]
MCGRYALGRGMDEIRQAFGLAEEAEPAVAGDPRSWPPLEELEPDYNVSPGKRVYAVLGPPPGRPDPAPAGPRHLSTLRWGLVPSWAKDPNVGYKMINARGETVAEKPAYRAAFARRRCLLPADAYYEWQLLPDAAPGTAEPGTSPATDPEHRSRKSKSRKRPYAVRYADGSPLALAGVFERWRDPSLPEEDPAAWLWSCAVITTEAAPELAHIHERMPVVVPEDEWGTWLDPATDAADLRYVLDTTPVSRFEVHRVDTAVNSIRNNGARLLEPVPDGPEPGTETLF